MASECADDNLLWKWFFILWCLAASGCVKTVSGGCGSSSNDRHKHEEEECWYELWYFWFIVVLVFITIVILVVFYCKQQVKRSTGRRARRRTPVLTMPIAPPHYEVPGHEPPPYHIAMTTSTVPGSGGAPSTAPGLGAPSTASSQQVPSLPGYVLEPGEYQAYDNLSMASTLSIGTVSNPPPYSPPPSSALRHTYHSQHQQADVAL